MQALIDQPEAADGDRRGACGQTRSCTPPLLYGTIGERQLVAERPARLPSVMTVWGYLLDGQITSRCPSVLKDVRRQRGLQHLRRRAMSERSAEAADVLHRARCKPADPALHALYRPGRRPSTSSIPATTRQLGGTSSFPISIEELAVLDHRPCQARPVDSPITMLSPYLDGSHRQDHRQLLPAAVHDPTARTSTAWSASILTLDQLAEIVESVQGRRHRLRLSQSVERQCAGGNRSRREDPRHHRLTPAASIAC